MAKIIQFIQDICLDPTCTHEWMRTSIREYAIPEHQIIFNYYGEQLNIIDNIYYISRFAKGRNKQEIEVSNELITQVVEFRHLKDEIILAIEKLPKVE